MDALKSLTSEIFNTIIVLAIGLSLGLAGWRFYREMQRSPRPENEDQLYLADMRRFYDQTAAQAQQSTDAPRS